MNIFETEQNNIAAANHTILTLPECWGTSSQLYRAGRACSLKSQTETILDLEHHTVSFASTQLCFSSEDAVINSMQINEYGCVPMKLYLQTLEFEFCVISVSHEIFF